MKRATMLSLAALMTVVIVPAAAHYLAKPGSDPLDDTLRAYDFRRINPPSNLVTVGSLYYIDPAGKHYTSICAADKSDLEGQVIASPSWEMQADVEHHGRFSTGVTVDFSLRLGGDIDDNYAQKVHASLTDIVLEEIPLGANRLILLKLMERPECSKTVTELLKTGGYVCQGQETLQATAEFKLDRNVQSKLTTEGKVTPEELKSILKQAIEAQSHQSVVLREYRLFAGSALKYGVLMNPTCLTPSTGRFERVLPRTAFDRVVNFVLFRVVERLFPAALDESDAMQASDRDRKSTAQKS